MVLLLRIGMEAVITSWSPDEGIVGCEKYTFSGSRSFHAKPPKLILSRKTTSARRETTQLYHYKVKTHLQGLLHIVLLLLHNRLLLCLSDDVLMQSFENIKFSEISNLDKKVNNLRGIIFDLGYSTTQIKDHAKGLSFNSRGKLNMKMGLNNISADDVINKLGEKELAKIFKVFGEEKNSNIISKKIISYRKNKNIETEDLVKIINSVKRKKFSKIHNATKVFQALRIVVNNEISELLNGLVNSFNLLPIGGIMVIVTFHSIEDKIVKFLLKNYSENKNSSRYLPPSKEKKILFRLLDKKPIIPNEKEISNNPASRSAKLRYGIKLNNNSNFSELKKKFNHLLEVENLTNKV